MPSGGSRPGAGRPRKTEAEKALLGTLRPYREAAYRAGAEAALDAAPRCAVPPAPEDLDEVEREWWDKLAEAVEESGTYSARDEPQFRNLVTAYAIQERHRLSRAALAERRQRRNRGRAEAKAMGVRYVPDDEEQEIDLEEMTVAERLSCSRTIASLLARFHLDPAARGKLPVRKAEQNSAPVADPDDIKPLPPLKLVTPNDPDRAP
jgi:hypothetical protein